MKGVPSLHGLSLRAIARLGADVTTTAGGHWYRQSILWLGAAIFIASLAGCIGMVLLGARYADEPLPVSSEQLLKMPTAHPADRAR
jgi:hypothetical protein